MKKIFFLLFAFTLAYSTALCNEQRVKASYYANRFHGKKTANGQVYHRDSLTCAHKTLAFGTIIKVKNPKNDKVVYVKVTDRGPYSKGRTIDLSYAAAKKLDIVTHGIASVDITVMGLNYNPTADKANFEFYGLTNIGNLTKNAMDSLMIRQDNIKMANDSLKLISRINLIN